MYIEYDSLPRIEQCVWIDKAEDIIQRGYQLFFDQTIEDLAREMYSKINTPPEED
jgi:hypothetical protein